MAKSRLTVSADKANNLQTVSADMAKSLLAVSADMATVCWQCLLTWQTVCWQCLLTWQTHRPGRSFGICTDHIIQLNTPRPPYRDGELPYYFPFPNYRQKSRVLIDNRKSRHSKVITIQCITHYQPLQVLGNHIQIDHHTLLTDEFIIWGAYIGMWRDNVVVTPSLY
jgi:hypothetical protein